MPLHPTLSAMLSQLASAPGMETLTPEAARLGYLALRATSGEAASVGKVIDRKIPGPGGEIPLRVYVPEGQGPFPMLVYFHGGGWVIGSIETHDPICRTLTNAAGCITVSVDYRLAPEHTFPAAIDDAYAATEWAAANAAELGGTGSAIAVGGDSAGGNLAAVVAQMARDRDGPALAYQVLVYPITDCAFDTPSYVADPTGYLLSKEVMAWFWDHYVPDEADRTNPLVSPLRAKDLSGLPPALLITAEFDPLRDEGEAYASRMRDAGVAVDTIRYDNMTHGFIQMGGMLEEARAALGEAASRLREAFAKASVS